MLYSLAATTSPQPDVEAAARYAARTVSIERDPASAADTAEDRAAATVHVGSAMCTSMDFAADVATESVSVTVSCVVDLSEATILRVPGTLSSPQLRRSQSTATASFRTGSAILKVV
ncbi:MAG TPA: hypothetical protein VGJ86_08275 [Acidimicrobiales bacterium]